VAVFVWTCVASGAVFFAAKLLTGLRVDDEEQIKGLDIGEHGMEAYAGFEISNVD